MGFTSAAANLLTDEQGIDSLNEVLNMDDGNIENLCKVLRRPGGQNASGNSDPGVEVSARAEENLKLVVINVVPLAGSRYQRLSPTVAMLVKLVVVGVGHSLFSFL